MISSHFCCCSNVNFKVSKADLLTDAIKTFCFCMTYGFQNRQTFSAYASAGVTVAEIAFDV